MLTLDPRINITHPLPEQWVWHCGDEAYYPSIRPVGAPKAELWVYKFVKLKKDDACVVRHKELNKHEGAKQTFPVTFNTVEEAAHYAHARLMMGMDPL